MKSTMLIQNDLVFRHICRRMHPALMFILVLLLSGCIGGGSRTRMVKKYTLEYSSPVVQGLSLATGTIRVERFTVAQNYNSTAMVYSPEAFKRQEYQHSRWRVNPGDMVTDYVLRDLRSQGLFNAVFSYRDTEDARYILEGEVDEFLEIDEKEGGKAVLGITITLLDMSQKEITKRIIFQNNYRFNEVIEEQTTLGLVRGMSSAMEKLSKQLIQDLYRVLTNKRS
ncbi:MAG: ABC-type transport auxiliary lipoprotein family protein [Proteobacteria bacterium]|nr:ABC-type transport auxiliary lipoprotein family protein [Pseudomonadota bacterium]